MRHTIIIAEAGINHNGDINMANKMIEAASAAGADYVKFQTYKTEKLVSKNAFLAEYQKNNLNTHKNTSQYDILKKYEFDLEAHIELMKVCHKKGIKFLSTAFDLESIDLLSELNIPIFKIPSGEITNLPYLEKIALTKKPVLISTGMSNLEEIRTAMKVFLSHGYKKKDITVLHCNTQYPTPMKDVNLKAMLTISDEFGISVGYSDHTLGIEVPIAAVALGASVIEKHFTLDRNLSGPDHKASLEPHELKKMIESIRNIEKALGSGEKKTTDSEMGNKIIARKSIHILKHKIPGEVLALEDIIMLRPGDGISPMDYKKTIGRKILNELFPGQKLQWTDIQN
jgi:N-acetylneuraminate synthase/N,N'-diacetyllegionaminate synthase